MLNTRTVAEKLDMSPLEVVRRIRRNEIRAKKWGWNWAVEASEVERVRAEKWYQEYLRRRQVRRT